MPHRSNGDWSYFGQDLIPYGGAVATSAPTTFNAAACATVVTVGPHNLALGDLVFLSGHATATALNDIPLTVVGLVTLPSARVDRNSVIVNGNPAGASGTGGVMRRAEFGTMYF